MGTTVAQRTLLVVLLLGGCQRSFPAPTPAGPGTVYGTVVYQQPGSDQPSPAAGAAVRLLGSSLSTTARGDGTFLISGIQTSTGTLLFAFTTPSGSPLQAVVELSNYAAGAGIQTSVGTITLGANATIQGTVLRGDARDSPTGNGGSVVFVPEGPFTTTTGDDGSFSLNALPAGTIQLSVFRAGYQAYALGNIQLQPGQDVTLSTVVLTPIVGAAAPGAISGQLYFNPALANASGCTVIASASGTPLSGIVQSNGTFTIAGAPEGVYTVEATCPGYASASATNVLVTSGGTAITSITLGLTAATSAAASSTSSSGGTSSGGSDASTSSSASSSSGSTSSGGSNSSSGAPYTCPAFATPAWSDGGHSILLVDNEDDSSTPALPLFQRLMAGMTDAGYDIILIDESGDESWSDAGTLTPSAAQLAAYQTVIWFTGGNSAPNQSGYDTPVSTDQETLLSAWLNTGEKNLILFSQGLGDTYFGPNTSNWTTPATDILFSDYLPAQGAEENPYVACDAGECGYVDLDDSSFVVDGTSTVGAGFADLLWSVGNANTNTVLINANIGVDVLATVASAPLAAGSNHPEPVAIGARNTGTAGTSTVVYVGFLLENVAPPEPGFSSSQAFFNGVVRSYACVP